MKISVISPPLSKDPVSWVHRYESLVLTKELRRHNHDVEHRVFSGTEQLGSLDSLRFLRLSDELMLRVTSDLSALGISYAGPEAGVLNTCYDKLVSTQIVAEAGISCPATMTADTYRGGWKPVLLKPRRGSDSLGVRVYRSGRIPEAFSTQNFLVQPFLPSMEITVGVLGKHIGRPLWIVRPLDKVYSFRRKHFVPTPRVELSDPDTARAARRIARTVAEIFGIRYSARVDLLFDPNSGAFFFLECDAFPAVPSTSSFAESLERSGMGRKDQLRRLLEPH